VLTPSMIFLPAEWLRGIANVFPGCEISGRMPT
jgi:hypothetical protein